MMAAALLGSVIMGFGGLRWAVVLMGFFLSSSLLSRLFRRQKIGLDEKYAKSDERDAGQVLANGGFAGVFVLLQVLFPDNNLAWLGFAGALAAANADTWATELGALSPKPPRLIISLRTVERGTSGGVSVTGTLASLSGGAAIGLLAWALWPPTASSMLHPAAGFAAITLAGFSGSLVDSLLGATLQGVYYCPNCQKETERHPMHTCGSATLPKRGLHWLNNDCVNAVCTLTGGLIATLALLF